MTENKVNKVNKLQLLSTKENCSWISLLNPDPETDKYKPNKSSREVKSGHYVNVKPTPLPNPFIVTLSSEMVNALGLDYDTCQSNEFISLFSGNVDTNKQTIGKHSWATPYALSIYGKEMYSNCPFKNGNGYGDGRAISISEIILDDSSRWELQLKGSGTTPFCRGADGRAVLRSCIREFMASEAMYHLRIPTTRALSVIASNTEKVSRQWYSDKGEKIMENSICAVLCRMSSSFIRVGHIELYARRVNNSHQKNNKNMDELKLMVNHAIFREFPHLIDISDEQEKYILMLKEVGILMANMTAEWLRVGYTQGNFNSDNCHIAGKTLDYGPFGFIELFDPHWNMWEGGGVHFSFMNQPLAGNKNFSSLVDSIIPLLDEEHVNIALNIKNKQYQIAMDKANLVWAKKLGFNKFDSKVAQLKTDLFKLMEFYSADFTLFWRQLAEIVGNFPIDNVGENVTNITNSSELFNFIENCFYKKLTMDDKYKWVQWLAKWLMLIKTTNENYKTISKNMKNISPKFIPREWMLKSAYEKANVGDYSIMNELQTLFKTPYDEHNDELTKKYYKKMNFKSTNNSSVAGTTVMTCSS